MGTKDRGTAPPRRRSYLIKRPRLTRLLDESGARIILLIAPAGYGKTTLAREWLAGKDGVAWFSGSPAMADVAALAAGVAEVLAPPGEAEAAVATVQALAAGGQGAHSLAKAVAALVGEREIILALDDCHYAAGSPESETFLTELISATSFRVVVTTRVSPAWVEPRLAVYGDAIVLGIDELRFTGTEARSVLGASGEVDAPIVAQARGWPAVIGLAARRGDAPPPDSGLVPAELYSFFAEDLFEQLSADVKHALFLLALCGDTDQQFAGGLLGPNRDAFLSAAVRHGFVTRARDWIVIHPLLRTFLRDRLNNLESCELVVAQAAAALAEARRWDACLELQEAFPAYDLLAGALEEAMDELLASGRIATLRRWLRVTSATGVNADPWGLLAEAEMSYRSCEFDTAQALGERVAGRTREPELAARGHLVAARAAHFQDDDTAFERSLGSALALQMSPKTRRDVLWAAFAKATERDPTRAFRLLEEMTSLDDQTAEHALRLAYARGHHAYYTGEPQQAVRFFGEAYPLLGRTHDPLLRTGFATHLSSCLIGVAEYPEALRIAEEALADARSNGLDFAADYGLLMKAAALIGMRRLLSARRVVEELQRRSSRTTDHFSINATFQAVRLRIAIQDLKHAEILLQPEPFESASLTTRAEFFGYRALVLAASGRTKDAEAACRDALSRHATGADGWALVTNARAVITLEDSDADSSGRAISLLREVIRSGHRDSVVMSCRAYPALAAAGATDPELRRELTATFIASRDIDLGRRAGLEMPRELRRQEGLSPREREVYELLVQGRSNREIAETLFIGESTAKVHVRHIFEKLGVHTRAEAARAQIDVGASE